VSTSAGSRVISGEETANAPEKRLQSNKKRKMWMGESPPIMLFFCPRARFFSRFVAARQLQRLVTL
jgi:hypothetical protein